ncbi:PAS domain-containing protein [Desulfohalobiaceae bacterium Ax17]|uniref:sensor histidine kinase n=1 Tax=Desulfovulcanus ferrireducens TaxID=2831190 RepID=UPI00207BCE11|nr:ATP-binding protein [Desulfovulcanus ferrireducens]MBT8762516.1 PAS domain-containing protein [Desulfovulcanus ferrireducens]
MNSLSLKLRIILLFWAVLTLALILPSSYFINILKQEVRRDVIFNVQKETDLVQWILLNQAVRKEQSDLDKLIKEIGRRIEDRITYITENGIVIADSQVSEKRLKKLDNHATRPEIIQARSEGEGVSIRFSPTLKKELVYYARRIDQDDGLPEGYLRISRPYSTIAAVLSRIKTNIWSVTIFSLFVSGILVYFLIYNLTRRFDAMVKVTQAIGQGDLAKRLYSSPGKEFEPLVQAINEMAENIEKNVETISRQKVELEAILNGMDAGIVALDKQGRVLKFNRAFEQIFSYTPSYLGKKLLEISINPKLQEACNKALKSNTDIKNLELSVGSNYYSVNIVVTKKSKDLGAIVVFHDISKLKKVENMRKDFVANASHELRTPLTSIKGYTETLLENEELLKEKGRELLKVILKNTEQMIYLLEDILKLSRIESGKTKFRIEEVDVGKVAQKAWENSQHMVGDKEIVFRGLVKDGCPYVLADEEALLLVFQNLIQNSIKFVPKENGEIKIVCEDKNDKVWIGVEDNGPGIPQEDQGRVFERFYQVKKYRDRGVKGTGLGLSICRNIIRNLNGQIWVQSPVPNKENGCIIWFSLPKAN